MSASQLEAYEMLKQKLGQKEANLFIEYIENNVGKEVEIQSRTLATSKE